MSLDPLLDFTFRAILTSASTWSSNWYPCYWTSLDPIESRTVVNRSTVDRDAPRTAGLVSRRRYLRRSRVERRARVKRVSFVDYYRARWQSNTHTCGPGPSLTWWNDGGKKTRWERGPAKNHHQERVRGQRESPGKPATALDGRRDHTLTSTTFREPPPGTY